MKGYGMKTILALVALLGLSPAAAQDKYQGTGMSVTGPASDKKPPERAATSGRPEQPKASTAGAHTTSDVETPGVNSATANSH